MDLLGTFNIDELPEQQTRTSHLVTIYPDFNLNLGFDACCTCGKSLAEQLEKGTTVPCPSCRSVQYCSEGCRKKDTQQSILRKEEAEEEEENAMGHSAIVCALLQACRDDEIVETGEAASMDPQRKKAALDRISSELESYPATLANVLSEGPCYMDVLKRRASTSVHNNTAPGLVIHVLGASEEAELWDAPDDNFARPLAAYADAISDMADAFRLNRIELYFIGPDCPLVEISDAFPLLTSSTSDRSHTDENKIGQLVIKTVNGIYNAALLQERGLAPADIVVFFNPGFTVPEYNWSDALRAISPGTPFLSTTNTELEGIADCQYLLDQDKIQAVPAALAELFGLHDSNGRQLDEMDEDDTVLLSALQAACFFSENPHSTTRVRQSGTMANDLYVKNRWILGGVIDSFDPSKILPFSDTPSKRTKTGAEANSKATNPALI